KVGSGTFLASGDFGVVLFTPRRIGQHVDRFGERLKAPLGVGFVRSLIAVRVIFAGEFAESVPDLVIACRALDSQDLVVVDLHSRFQDFWVLAMYIFFAS